MQLVVLDRNGHQCQLQLQSIVSIDGVPFSMLQPVTLETLNQRLSVLEAAVAAHEDRWQMMLETAEQITFENQPPDNQDPQTTGESTDGSR